MFFYSLGLLLAIIFASPYWLLRMAWGGRYRDGLMQRLGGVPVGLRKFVAQRTVIWVHAVSVGEVMAASHLIRLLDGIDKNFPVVISTTTPTGQRLAKELYDCGHATETRVFYCPLDFAWIVRRYLHVLRPRMLVLMESELWPRMLFETNRAGIPVVVVNGRISDRSLPRYQALRKFWRPFLSQLRMVFAQSDIDAVRFAAIGVPSEKIQATGNLKYDVRAASHSIIVEELRKHLSDTARVIVAGSTLQSEDTYLLSAFQKLLPEFPELVLILAPRHPERFSIAWNLMREMKVSGVLRSEWMQHPEPIRPGSVFLLDSIGELASIYSLAAIAFVGGSLVAAGGHNPLEPAQFGVPIATGPHTENFRDIVALLEDHAAISLVTTEGLAEQLAGMLQSATTVDMGRRARQVFQEQAGASERCFQGITNILAEQNASGSTGRGYR